MNRRLLAIIAVTSICGGWAGNALGEEPKLGSNWPFGVGMLIYPESLLRACCDTYCPKPLPCPPTGICTASDCYCGKPIPCIAPFTACCADCGYCFKPCPELCRPLSPHFFWCAGSNPPCAKSRMAPWAEANSSDIYFAREAKLP